MTNCMCQIPNVLLRISHLSSSNIALFSTHGGELKATRPRPGDDLEEDYQLVPSAAWREGGLQGWLAGPTSTNTYQVPVCKTKHSCSHYTEHQKKLITSLERHLTKIHSSKSNQLWTQIISHSYSLLSTCYKTKSYLCGREEEGGGGLWHIFFPN